MSTTKKKLLGGKLLGWVAGLIVWKVTIVGNSEIVSPFMALDTSTKPKDAKKILAHLTLLCAPVLRLASSLLFALRWYVARLTGGVCSTDVHPMTMLEADDDVI